MALPPALKGPWNPFRITGTPMPPNLLLMCKILAVAALGTNHQRILPDPFLPFLPGLDQLADPVIFRTGLRTVFVLSAVALLFNRWVRGSALLLGACFLVAVVSSKAYYGNNKTFCGLALVLAGLSDFDRPAYLLRWQLSITYFGAALNKLLEPDWHSGLFFEHWAAEKVKNPVYLAVSGLLPPLVAGKLMCWGTIVAEFAVSVGLFVPRLVPPALWVNILFQVGLLQFTGGTFTLFFYGMTAITLAFVSWPETLAVYRNRTSRLQRFLQALDPDGIQKGLESEGRLRLEDRGRVFTGFAAVQRLVLFSPVFWLTATALLALLPAGATGWRRLLVAAVLVFCLPVWGWRSRTTTGST